MAEITWPVGHMREGHVPDMKTVFLDLHRLLAIFLSSRSFAEIAREDIDDPLIELQEWEVDEITRILITSAVMGRILDDRGGPELDQKPTNCGELIEDLIAPGTWIPLTLREACNKIIHATKVRTDLEQDAKNRLAYFNPIMYFYGQRNGKDWKATLFIQDFVRDFYVRYKNA